MPSSLNVLVCTHCYLAVCAVVFNFCKQIDKINSLIIQLSLLINQSISQSTSQLINQSFIRSVQHDSTFTV